MHRFDCTLELDVPALAAFGLAIEPLDDVSFASRGP